MEYKTQPPSEQEETYTVFVDNMIVAGPKVNASPEELKEFFDGVKAYNKKEGREIVRVYGPKKSIKD